MVFFPGYGFEMKHLIHCFAALSFFAAPCACSSGENTLPDNDAYDDSAGADIDAGFDIPVEPDAYDPITEPVLDIPLDTPPDTPAIPCEPSCPAMDWVAIPAGSFMMGSSSGDTWEAPVHSVNVPAFEITRIEITLAQFRACHDSGYCWEPSTAAGAGCTWGTAGRDNHPINCMTWDDADNFCKWVGGRLPSEAEWEFAARGEEGREYPWGNEAASCSYAIMNEGGTASCGGEYTWPVCSKPAGNTPQGLCDMAGNVWEWVHDLWHDDYTGAPADGSAWDSPGLSGVIRGGDFDTDAYQVRATYRYAAYSSHGYIDMGFRCAR